MKSEKLCCLSLETGAIVIAGIQMFFCTISLIIGSISMSHKEDLVDNIINSYNYSEKVDAEEIRGVLINCKL